MKENGINIWLKNVANILGNKKIIFLKVNQNDIQEIINDLKPLTMYYISIIKIEDLKENKHVLLKGMHHIIISNSSENIENMKLLINREIIYIEDMNSIQKLISLLTNKSLDHNNVIKYELLQKVDFESLLKENHLNAERFVLNRLLLLQKISCNFEYMDKEFLVTCLKNYYAHNKLLASFAQLLFRLATLDFISSSKKIGGKIYQLLGVHSKIVNSKKLDLPMNQISKNFRVYDLNEKPFVTETKLEIAQKLVKLNIKELDVTKISKITDLPLKIIEKLYKTINLK